MPTNIITTEDLTEFKLEVLQEIRNILRQHQGSGLKRYLKSGEVMEQLKISPGTLQNLRLNGTLPYSKIGGVIFYDARDIERVMEENRIYNRI
ncbi:helix-turn-helix domain-containing protein [Muricauda sp. JGD-17]|uniref:Helix-turn-helix domain-containing protein n=1 Tax=Flagellimonas ochracea TaxID=2696472 RepID=A0A964WX42_9FLAO|nr:helix-turn-helix domain-containing protein [Allomuricauda ochracea]NAY91418.1 helix-turn-helix domain-containing protein [Allomuricauda ochracea]